MHVINLCIFNILRDFPGGSDVKESLRNAGDPSSIPGSPLQHSCRIPWTEESGRLQSMGSQKVGHD